MEKNRIISVLVISNYMICPPISGGAKRFLSPVQNMNAEDGVRYSFVYLSYTLSEVCHNKEYLENLPLVDKATGVLTTKDFQYDWQSTPEQFSRQVWYTMNRDFVDAVCAELDAHKYDIVQVIHSQLGWIVPHLRMRTEAKIVLDYQNIEWLVFKRWLPYARPEKVAELERDYLQLKLWEEQTLDWFDAIFCISPVEKAELEKMVKHAKVYYVPTGAGINDAEYLPQDDVKKRYDMVFVGSMNWFPNVQALMWLLEEVLPLIHKQRPNATLELVGSGTPDADMLELLQHSKHVTFWGELDDERGLLHSSRVFVSPIWIGAGVRLKNPTAWASKLPVVATSLSVEGLEYTPNEDILIGDTPQEFADQVLRLLDDSSYANSIAERGYATYKERYSSSRITSMWRDAYKLVLYEG